MLIYVFSRLFDKSEISTKFSEFFVSLCSVCLFEKYKIENSTENRTAFTDLFQVVCLDQVLKKGRDSQEDKIFQHDGASGRGFNEPAFVVLIVAAGTN